MRACGTEKNQIHNDDDFDAYIIFNIKQKSNQINIFIFIVYKSCLLKSTTVHEHIISANSMHIQI